MVTAPACAGGHVEGLPAGRAPAAGRQPGRRQEQDGRQIPPPPQPTPGIHPASQVGGGRDCVTVALDLRCMFYMQNDK